MRQTSCGNWPFFGCQPRWDWSGQQLLKKVLSIEKRFQQCPFSMLTMFNLICIIWQEQTGQPVCTIILALGVSTPITLSVALWIVNFKVRPGNPRVAAGVACRGMADFATCRPKKKKWEEPWPLRFKLLDAIECLIFSFFTEHLTCMHGDIGPCQACLLSIYVECIKTQPIFALWYIFKALSKNYRFNITRQSTNSHGANCFWLNMQLKNSLGDF